MSTFSENAPPVCLLAENSNRLVSLVRIMQNARIHGLMEALRDLWLQATFAKASTDVRYRNASLTHMKAELGKIDACCDELDLPVSRKHAEDCLGLVNLNLDPQVRFDGDALEKMSMVLSNNIEKEMSTKLFFVVPHEAAKMYRNPLAGWEYVVSRWPKITLDIEECSKCFTFERYAAAIFHVLLVAEFGVIQLADFFDVSGDKPGWGSVERLERILAKKYSERTPFEQRHSSLLKDNANMMVAVKDSWRHKITHVDNKLVWLDADFSPNIATEVINSTRGFMRRLSQELPQPEVVAGLN